MERKQELRIIISELFNQLNAKYNYLNLKSLSIKEKIAHFLDVKKLEEQVSTLVNEFIALGGLQEGE